MATTPDPYAAQGGGVMQPDGTWKPKTAAGVSPVATPPTPVSDGQQHMVAPPTPVAAQATAASAYSPTPQATSTSPTSNMGTQDVVRNTWLQQATQPLEVDRTSADFRQPADAYAAASERARRDQVAQNAEAATAHNLGGSGAQQVQDRMAGEQAAQGQGSFEADLVQKNLQMKHDQITNALNGLYGIISDDQKTALQQQLAQLDAQVRREGIASTERVGMADVDVRKLLGLGNLDLGRAQLGANIGMDQAQLNQQAMLALMGGA